MTILLLVRHGRTTANATGILAGRTPGVRLDEIGREQARAAGRRLAGVALAAVVSSPMERCLETARALCEARLECAADPLAPTPGPVTVTPDPVASGPDPVTPEIVVDDALAEVDYGEWSGRELKELAREELWRTVQAHPSAARFPGGESMVAMAQRAVAAVRARQDRIADESGAEAVWVAVSHGDIIKAVLADALGLHLDQFQRLVVSPASVSVIRYTPARPYVLTLNSTSGPLRDLLPAGPRPGQDAAVGGGAGPATEAAGDGPASGSGGDGSPRRAGEGSAAGAGHDGSST